MMDHPQFDNSIDQVPISELRQLAGRIGVSCIQLSTHDDRIMHVTNISEKLNDLQSS